MGDDCGRRGKLEFDPPNTSVPPQQDRETVRPRASEPGKISEKPREAEPRTHQYAAAAESSTNKPIVLSVLYMTSVLIGLTGFVAFILALVWNSEQGEGWEASHYQYHIMTFLLWLGTTTLSIILIFTIIGALIGVPLLFLAVVWVFIRAIMSLIRASNREPMPNPGTWLA